EAKPEDFEPLARLMQDLEHLQSILIICPDIFARFLPEAPKQTLGFRQAEDFLKQAGFSIIWRLAINPLPSLIWGRLMLLFQALGFDAMADYCLYQMRANYVGEGDFGTFQLILGRRLA